LAANKDNREGRQRGKKKKGSASDDIPTTRILK
jgi:hypothetical protein